MSHKKTEKNKQNKLLQLEKKGIKTAMCRKLNEISKMTPTKILETYCTEPCRYAISMSELMKKLDIPVVSYDFSLSNPVIHNEDNIDDIIGAIVLSGDDLSIFVSDKCSESEKRYVIAHEIGHCCLHSSTLKSEKIEYAKDSTSNEPHEKEAHKFALDLLLPEGNVRYAYRQLIVKSLEVLADIFCVPISLMREKLDILGLRYE